MDEKKKNTIDSNSPEKQDDSGSDILAKLIVKKFPDFVPQARKKLQNAAIIFEDFSRSILKVFSEIIIPLSEIDWDQVNKKWIKTAENIGKKGWTIPLHIDLNEMINISEMSSATDMDKAFARYYSNEANYAQLREGLLQNDHLAKWKPLLKQCFENYEKKNHHIAIPSLFLILEGFGHHLLHPRYSELKPNQLDAKIKEKFAVVRKAADEDSIDMAFYASAQFFIINAFKYANFEGENVDRPMIINRNWVLHGRDDVSQWKDIDALRLFNAIHTMSILDFSVPEEAASS